MSFFLEIALRNVARGFFVHPLIPNVKRPLLKDWPNKITQDIPTLEAWGKQWPNAGCGIGATEELCFLESDDRAALEEKLGQPVPQTFTVQGRENRPHFYFRQTDAGRELGNADVEGIFEFKQWHRYVVGEGTIHEKTGQPYYVLDESPIIDLPDWIVPILRDLYGKDKKRRQDPSEPVGEGGRHAFLARVAGQLRNNGLEGDAIFAALIPINEARCNPPLPLEDVRHTADSMERYPIPPPEPELIISRPKEPNKVTDWREHYHSAEEHDNVGPPEFLIEGILQRQAIMGLGAFIGQKKTLLAVNIAWSLCSGKPLLGRFEVTRRPARVLYLGPENGLISFSNRVNRIGLREYLGRTFFYTTMSREKLPLADLSPEEIEGAAVFIDTCVRYAEGDENSATHMKEFSELIFALIRNGAEAVIVLHHSPKAMTKASELSLDNSFRGTGELSAFLSAAMAMRTQNMDDEYNSASLIRFVKQRDFEPKPASFEVMTDRETCRMTFVEDSQGAVVAQKSLANQDRKEAAALRVIQENPTLSQAKIVRKLREMGIERGRTWVGNKRFDLLNVGIKVERG